MDGNKYLFLAILLSNVIFFTTIYTGIMKYFKVEEFAKELEMSPESVRRAIRKGHIYAFRPGLGKKSGYRIAATELERLQIKANFERENDTRRA